MVAMASRLPGFYHRSVDERRALLAPLGLSAELAHTLEPSGGLPTHTAVHMIENVIGVLGLPLGVALNFVIDGDAVIIPMAVEEPSIIAACSFIAKLAADGGGFTTSADAAVTVAQVQLLDVPDVAQAELAIRTARTSLMRDADRHCEGLVQRGGGCRDIRVRVLQPLPADDIHGDLDGGGAMVIIHIVVDTVEAMGANAVNTIAEALAPTLEQLTGGRSRLRILTNLADERCGRARMRIPYRSLAANDGRDVAMGMVEAYRFAARDPWRACTHNKGIMNGVDAVAIATGNDWRAIEAGAHAYAARHGRYTSLTRYRLNDDEQALEASIELPLALGTVGGATRVHPTLQACRALLGGHGASVAKLMGVCAAVGLAQNAGALRALATEGIQRGHMTLHARQVALAAGCTAAEVDVVAAALVADHAIKPQHAQDVLAALRARS
jgi:hydroxymethylglutaryl-CoA reductase